MLNFKIKFWFIYFIIIISIQMFFFGIYNIPIYKIYCELNNYYSYGNLNNFFENKLILLNDFYYLNNYNFYNYLNNKNHLYFNYIYTNYKFNIELLNNYFVLDFYTNIKNSFFHLDFIIYNFLNFFHYIIYYNNIKEEIELKIIYIVYFNTSVTSINLVEFLSLQDHIYVYPSETYLVFFRIYNPTNYIIKGISIYLLSPYEVNLYLYKIQCFCYDEILLNSFESVELPILFYIDSNINNYINFNSIFFFQIQIIYLFILNSFI